MGYDPWLLVARARRCLATGHWAAAEAAFRRAEIELVETSAGARVRAERRAVTLWLDAAPAAGPGWMALVRAATQREPLAVARTADELGGPDGRFARGVALLLAGHLEEARRPLSLVAESADAGPLLGAVAHMLLHIVNSCCAGQLQPGSGVHVEAFETLRLPWLADLCRRAFTTWAGGDGGLSIGAENGEEARRWAAGVMDVVEGVSRLSRGVPAAQVFERSALGFRRLGAPVLEVWARCGQALALAVGGDPGAREAALSADAAARSVGVDAAEALAFLALGLADGDASGELLAFARATARDRGVRWPLVDCVRQLVQDKERLALTLPRVRAPGPRRRPAWRCAASAGSASPSTAPSSTAGG